jgi:hypothetical protein
MRTQVCVFASCLVIGGSLLHGLGAEPPKVERLNNHVMPLLAEITFKDEKVGKAKVMVSGLLWGVYLSTHAWNLTGESDASVRVWLDTVAQIKDIDDQRLTVVFKDGTERQFQHRREGLRVYHANDSTEKISVVKLRQIDFLRAPRKDKENQAMFDHWRYSPYTGEKLPAVEDDK